MKNKELMKIEDLLTLKEMAISKENMPVIKKKLVDFFRKTPLEKLREEQLLEVVRFLHWFKMEQAKIRAPSRLNIIKYEEIAKVSKTRQGLIVLITEMFTGVLNELNKIAVTSSSEVCKFVEKAKYHLEALASETLEEISGQSLPVNTQEIDADFSSVGEVFTSRVCG